MRKKYIAKLKKNIYSKTEVPENERGNFASKTTVHKQNHT